MFNLFNKKSQESETPEWVQYTCRLLSISYSLDCKYWDIVKVYFTLSLLKDADRAFDSSFITTDECCKLLIQLIASKSLDQWDNNSSIAENVNFMYNNVVFYKDRFLKIVEFVNA